VKKILKPNHFGALVVDDMFNQIIDCRPSSSGVYARLQTWDRTRM